MAERYILHVTAGPDYDPSTHVEVLVNGPKSTRVVSTASTTSLKVRVQNYRGLPRGSPSTSDYFTKPPHEHDQYSIAFSFVPHTSVSGSDLIFGNDFDRPIRDRLPPGFGTAFRIVKWAIDPGLDGDVYSDTPHLYGPLLSSMNLLRIGPEAKATKDGEGHEIPEQVHEDGIEEGADDDQGKEAREDVEMPETAAERKRWALTEGNREEWEWEKGRVYRGDFFNGYLDFNEFRLILPGFSLSVLDRIDAKDGLRYVLKNRKTDEVFFVVVFTLLLKEDVEKAEAEGKKVGETPETSTAAGANEAKGKEEQSETGGGGGGDDDVD